MRNFGKFFVFEGMDGSGKTTVSKNICTVLQKIGTPCVWTKEPTELQTGLQIRKFLKGEINLSPEEQIDAFIEDRENSVHTFILPNLQNNVNVILDRYYYSTAAYQSSKKFSAIEILNLNLKKNFPKPDLVIYLDLPPEISLQRIENRLKDGSKTERFETLSQLKKIELSYKEVIPPNAFFVSAVQSQEEVEKICIAEIQKVLKN